MLTDYLRELLLRIFDAPETLSDLTFLLGLVTWFRISEVHYFNKVLLLVMREWLFWPRAIDQVFQYSLSIFLLRTIRLAR